MPELEEVNVNYDELREFVEKQMKQRGMNPNEFAALVGVSHTTIGRLLRPRTPTKKPSPDLFIKLAKATGINLSTIIALVVPDVEHVPFNPKAMERAERIEQLPPEKQNSIDEIIVGMSLGEKK